MVILNLIPKSSKVLLWDSFFFFVRAPGSSSGETMAFDLPQLGKLNKLVKCGCNIFKTEFFEGNDRCDVIFLM